MHTIVDSDIKNNFTDNQNNFTIYGLKGYRVFHIRLYMLCCAILCYFMLCYMLRHVMLFYCRTEQPGMPGVDMLSAVSGPTGMVLRNIKHTTFLCYFM